MTQLHCAEVVPAASLCAYYNRLALIFEAARHWRLPKHRTVWGPIVAGVLLAFGTPAWAIRPDNPVVRTRVDRAVKFLESAQDGRLGAKALVGLTLANYGSDPEHPKIVEAIKAVQAALADGPDRLRADIYSTGIAIMFLVAVDPSRYRYEIEGLVESLHLRQKQHGAWGYPQDHPNHGQTCDTSMTQYAVLGLWEAEDQAGVETPARVWDRVARWLILTQDPNGGFGYQGKPAARLGQREKQAGVRHSMTAAALGSLYIVKDRLGLRKVKKALDDDTPAALEPLETPAERAKRLKTTIDPRHFTSALGAGHRWMHKNVSDNAAGS